MCFTLPQVRRAMQDDVDRSQIMLPKVWNAVMPGLVGAHRYCPACGERMRRSVAVEEQYIRRSIGYDFGSQNMGKFGGTQPRPGIKSTRQVQVTPIYDTCVDCKQRIQHGSIKTRLS